MFAPTQIKFAISALRALRHSEDAFPFLLWIPDFLAPWMQQAKKIRKMQRALYLQFFDECQQRVDANDGEFFMANVIRDKANHGLGREQMR